MKLFGLSPDPTATTNPEFRARRGSKFKPAPTVDCQSIELAGLDRACAARGAGAIARSVRLLQGTETPALHPRQLSVAHRGPRTARCAARTSFRLLRS